MAEEFNLTWLWCGRNGGAWSSAPGVVWMNSESVPMDCYEFLWLSQGKMVISIDGKPYHAAGPSSVALIRPGHIFRWEHDPLEPSAGYFFMFRFASSPADWPAPAQWPVMRTLPIDDILRPLFQYVVRCCPVEEDEPINGTLEWAVNTMMLAFILGQTERAHMFPASYPLQLQRALQWMRELVESSPARKVTSDDCAAGAGLSARHTRRLFHEFLGHGPLDVLYMYRIARSISGLRAGQKVESLAHEYGFADAAHYANRFRNMYGCSPKDVQKALAANIPIALREYPFI